MKRLSSVGLIGLALAISFQLTISPTSHAWSGDLPDCSWGDFDPREHWTENYNPDGLDNPAPSELGSSVPFYAFEDPDFIVIAASYFQSPGNLLFFGDPNRTIMYEGTWQRYDKATHAFVGTGDYPNPITRQNQTCIAYVNNASYMDGYTGHHYTEYSFGSSSPSPSPSPSPDPTCPDQTLCSSNQKLEFNPIVRSDAELAAMDGKGVLIQIYKLLLAIYLSSAAIVIFYTIYRVAIWFLPRYWNLEKHGRDK